MRLTINTILAVGISSLVLALLIGQRFNAKFAGGTGYLPQHSGTLVRVQHPSDCTTDDVIDRGEFFYTCRENTFAEYDFLGTRVMLDTNTEMTLIDNRQSPPTLALIGGRIVVDGPAVVTVRDVRLEIDGRATIVHYGWKYLLVVKELEGNVILTNGGNPPADIEDTASINTKSDIVPIESGFTFDLTSDAVRAFYEWALVSS